MEGFFWIYGEDYQEGIDNFVLTVGMYDHDSCISTTN